MMEIKNVYGEIEFLGVHFCNSHLEDDHVTIDAVLPFFNARVNPQKILAGTNLKARDAEFQCSSFDSTYCLHRNDLSLGFFFFRT